MRPKKPYVASLDEVTIGWEGDYAIIQYKEPGVAAVHLRIGPEVQRMEGLEILDLHNGAILAQREIASRYRHVALEIPPGRPQVECARECDQWVPRGSEFFAPLTSLLDAPEFQGRRGRRSSFRCLEETHRSACQAALLKPVRGR